MLRGSSHALSIRKTPKASLLCSAAACQLSTVGHRLLMHSTRLLYTAALPRAAVCHQYPVHLASPSTLNPKPRTIHKAEPPRASRSSDPVLFVMTSLAKKRTGVQMNLWLHCKPYWNACPRAAERTAAQQILLCITLCNYS